MQISANLRTPGVEPGTCWWLLVSHLQSAALTIWAMSGGSPPAEVIDVFLAIFAVYNHVFEPSFSNSWDHHMYHSNLEFHWQIKNTNTNKNERGSHFKFMRAYNSCVKLTHLCSTAVNDTYLHCFSSWLMSTSSGDRSKGCHPKPSGTCPICWVLLPWLVLAPELDTCTSTCRLAVW